MRKPILSVIIPYYNGEKYIENTIKSVLKSTLKDLEILLIDDGSPGDTGNICDYLANKYNNLHAVHKENGGIADARNRGIREANGKYIAFVDQDDTIDPDMYLSLIGIIEKYNCDLISSNFYMTDAGTGKKEISAIIKTNELLSEERLKELRKWLVMGEVMPPPEASIPTSIWTCVISSDLIKNNNIHFDSFIRYDDDWVFLLRCLAYSKNVYLCKQAYYNWMSHDASELHTAKYMPDIVERYENLRKFKLEYINNWCNATDEEIESFAAYFRVNAVYMTIYNESVGNNKLSVSRQMIRNVIQSNKSKVAVKESEQCAIKALIKKKGNKAGVVYKLAVHHLYYLALVACKIKR